MNKEDLKQAEAALEKAANDYANSWTAIKKAFIIGAKSEFARKYHIYKKLVEQDVLQEKHGLELEYFKSGQIKWTIPYINGKKHGLFKEYYKFGQIKKKLIM